MVKSKGTSSKSASLFDIRFTNLDHDVLVLKGNENDAASVFLAGKIALSVNEPLTIKKLSLRLYCTIRLDWMDSFTTSKGTFPKPVKFEKKIYEYNWDSAEMNQYLNNLYENVHHSASSIGLNKNNSSSVSLKSLGHSKKSKSFSNLSNLYLSSSSSPSSVNLANGNKSANPTNNHVLVQGNYELPFHAILPGSMPESVEGLPGASVVYRLEATMERGKFHNNMVCKKHLRVVRTLTTDAVELSETVAVDNTWPKKVEYSLNIPSKAIAIGSGSPISFMLVPLMKGLRLGDISIELVEYYSYMGYVPPSHSGERIINSKFIKKPSENDPNFQMDKWEVDTFLRVPPTLSKVTQDCDIENHIKVRHKIKFVIGLINPDGHTSELRATLPIQLFISPFVSISARHEDNLEPELMSKSPVPQAESDDVEEDLLFSNDAHSTSNTSLSELAERNANSNQPKSNSSSCTSFNGFMAPPIYEKHIYDRLWSDVSPIESPMTSGSVTPRSLYREPNDVQAQFSMSPLDNNYLTENLKKLSIQRQAQEADEQGSGANTPTIPTAPGGIHIRDRPRDRAVFNLDDENLAEPMSSPPLQSSIQQGDYLSRGRPIQSSSNPHSFMSVPPNNPLMSPGAFSPVHLSRANSEQKLNSTTMSKVPSYTQAMRGEAQESLLSPAYQPPLPGSNVNLAEVNRRFEDMNGSGQNTTAPKQRSILTRGSSSLSLRSKNSSNSSSPSNSRNVSSTNLTAMNLSRSSSGKKINGSGNNSHNASGVNLTISPSSSGATSPSPVFSMTPLSVSPNATQAKLYSTADRIVTQPSSSASNRSAAIGVPKNSTSSLSLQNLQFLNKKKEKK